MTTSEEIPSVKTSVEREARRRKRVFIIFLALLAIPLAIGLYAVAKAPSETDAVVDRVSPIVEENVTARVDQKIEPRVEEIVNRRATPIIQQTLDKQLDVQLDRAVTRQFRALTIEANPERQRMAVRVKELEDRVAALEKRLEALSGRPPLTHVPIPQP